MNEQQPHRARKRFGQNFLHDQGVIRRIAAAVHGRPDQQVLEIGPGQGALTAALLASGCQLLALELDRDLVPLLENKFGASPNFRLQQGDALALDLAACGPGKWRVVGNLPYNISTPLMFRLLGQRHAVVDMHFMLQKEVVDRLAAGPGSKAYGRLGIMTQYFCDVEALFDVPPGAFQPRPKVDSAVVRLTPHATLPHPARSEELLHAVVRTAFSQRRKTLRNALQGMIDSAALEQLDIDPGARAETLPLPAFVRIADYLVDHSARLVAPAADSRDE